MKYISFYTPDYKSLATRLIESLNHLNLKHEVEEAPQRGSWVRNCSYKPEFILKKWEASDVPVVWLDADAIVHSYPYVFDEITEDFACHLFDRKRLTHRSGLELLSGTLFFNKTPAAHKLLKEWVFRQIRQPNEFDQRTLANVRHLAPHSHRNLPASYCLIFDTMNKLGPPVIEHFQNSRKFR